MDNIPTDLKSLIIKVAELVAKSNFLEGQSNLLLGFMTSDPENLKKFATMTKAFSTNQTLNENTRVVARQLLDGGLSQYLPQEQSPKKQPSQKTHTPGSNVIQFPKWPGKNHDPEK
jgi:hypothetical protein